MDITSLVESFRKEVVTLRRDFHAHPELGFQEFRSQEIIIGYLKSIGLKPTPIASTGVTTLLEGKAPGKVVMLRADMDALPVFEQTGLPFTSCNDGIMHACGHDGHMAMLLVAAKILVSLQESIKGSIRFVFQPNEEVAGAYKLIEEHIMENPPIDGVFGAHLWSQLPSGTVDIVDGPQMAASHYFTVKITGKGGHAGFAHESVDPIIAASSLIQAVQSIQTRETNALDPAVIMFTEIHAGSNTTIVPEEVTIRGSIRFLYTEGSLLLDAFQRVAKAIETLHKVTVVVEFQVGNNLLSNDPKMSALMRDAAREIGNKSIVVTERLRTMAGEDFSEYLQYAPGAFAFIGIYNPKTKSTFPHHHPQFTIDENVLPIGVELYVRSALRFLSSQG
jgi:amidohydrolase